MKSCFLNALVLCALLAGAACADITPAAGPRLGPVSVVSITVAGREDIQQLVVEQFDIDSVRDNEVVLYVTPAEKARLEAMGYHPALSGPQPGGKVGYAGYHTYASLTSELQALAAAHPDICRLESMGSSVEGRALWAMLITNNPATEEDEPETCYMGSIHGDEPIGMEMCSRLVNDLLTNYGSLSEVTDLVDSTAIWILPLINPDGLEHATRYNYSGYDLNRSFPLFPSEFTGFSFDGAPLREQGRPTEVVEIMQWSVQHHFSLAANFHAGSLVVNYPYDDDSKPSGVNSPSPDDALFRDISLKYSIQNGPMYATAVFPQGITNGAEWYVITGGMQDWAYRYLSCNEVTIEISQNKVPSSALLPSFWNDNRDAMLAYLETVHMGVRGVVTDAGTAQPLKARVVVAGNPQAASSDPAVGNYHRMLLPGTYALTFSAPGYVSTAFADVLVQDGAPTRLDVQLQRTPTPTLPATTPAGLMLAAAAIIYLARKSTAIKTCKFQISDLRRNSFPNFYLGMHVLDKLCLPPRKQR